MRMMPRLRIDRITMNAVSPTRRVLSVFLFFAFSFLLGSGCASQAPAMVDEAPSIEQGPTNWAEVERVDVAAFKEETVEKDRKIEHDVPAVLMTSSADKGTLEEIDGFRIQVFASEVRNDAVKAEDELRLWIQSLSEQRKQVLGLKTPPTIYSSYKQPYYRVRMGDFESRSQAQPIVTALKSRFSGALVVPDVIQVRR